MTTIVSVDLDDATCYHAIHGLGVVPEASQGFALERCLPRFLEIFEATGVRATFFVVGRDVERDLANGGRGASWLKTALAQGHELANHSYGHAYDLARQSAEVIAEDLTACDRILRSLGARPRGFRAPGYTLSESLLRQVAALGYAYDSSILPSPGYYAAKLAAIGWMRLRGRRSESIAGGVAQFLSSRRPHLLAAHGLFEVPIGVNWLGLPYVGTFVLGGAFSRLLRSEAAHTDFLHLELHAIDLAHAVEDGLSAELAQRQPELKTPLANRTHRLVELLRARGGGVGVGAFVP